jgi:hypothetical protein|tara:strand:- start:153 stop:734 length:582 start_codon:yes stop_codon:yes gene_type:complete
MASEVQICNLALAKVGDEQITSLTENSKAARLCNLVYEPMRDTTLRSHPWNFAIQRVELAASTETPSYEYNAQFALPSDFLRLLGTNMLDAAKFTVEGNLLLCNASALKIKYIYQVTDPNKFDWLFIEALSARIAAELSIAMTDSRTLTVDLFNLFSTKLADARSADATEGTPDDITADTWLNSRVAFTGTGA